MSDTVPKREKKPYSNSYHSLEAIWSVLRRYASREHPLTIKEIHNYLRQMGEDAPSQATLARLLPQGKGVMDALYPGQLAEADRPGGLDAYREGDTLHIVVETPQGQVLTKDNLAVEAAPVPFRVPSYSTIEKQLKEGIPFDLRTFPFRLRCVAQVPGGKPGKVRLIPYDKYEDTMLDPDRRNNTPRRYYLSNVLTEGEWRIFSDLIQVYPFVTETQARKFLTVLNRLRPRPVQPPPSRYAYRRGNGALFRSIGILDEAIRAGRKVALTYGEYRLRQVKGRWTPVLVPRAANSRLEVEPYALMWSNGNYYLVARHRGMMNLRVDRILEAVPLNESFSPPADFDPVAYRDSSPVMYPGERTFVRMKCSTSLINTLVDFFGSLPQYATPGQDGWVEVTMSIAPSGLKLFALQYADRVEVLEPQSLRREILATLEQAARVYRS